jgi:hypothetical protein
LVQYFDAAKWLLQNEGKESRIVIAVGKELKGNLALYYILSQYFVLFIAN